MVLKPTQTGVPNRGLAVSTDGGDTFTNATLEGTGLPNDAPDCEGYLAGLQGSGFGCT